MRRHRYSLHVILLQHPIFLVKGKRVKDNNVFVKVQKWKYKFNKFQGTLDIIRIEDMSVRKYNSFQSRPLFTVIRVRR